MKHGIEIQLAAQLDAVEYAEYIARDSPDAARRFLAGVNAAIIVIGENPGIGHPREMMNPTLVGVRAVAVVGFHNHSVFYRVLDNGTVRVLRVRHAAMDHDAVEMDEGE